VGVWVGLATLVLFDVRPVHAAPQTAGPAAAAANGESALAYRLRRGVLLVLVGGVLAGIVLARRGWVLPYETVQALGLEQRIMEEHVPRSGNPLDTRG
jgi:hypothetical protein